MDKNQLARLHQLIDEWAADMPTITVGHSITTTEAEVKPERTDGKRAIRTKSTGDRVYLVDDNAKTKAWITSPEILSKLGFEMSDVQDLDDKDLLEYKMAPSVYRVD